MCQTNGFWSSFQLVIHVRIDATSPLADVTTTVDIDDIRFVRPDLARVSCTKHVRDDRVGGDQLPATGTTTYVVVDGGDGWRIVLAQTTPRWTERSRA